MSQRKLDILIATHGRPDLLENTLKSLIKAAPKGFLNQVVIVENGSHEGAETICKHLAEEGPIHYLWYPEANKSMALNAGLSLCHDGLIFMTDDDIIIQPEVLECYATQTLDWDRRAFFGGPTNTSYEEEPDEFIKGFLPSSAKGWSSSHDEMLERGFFIGFNWAAFKQDVIDAGGFNPDFGPGGRSGATGQESEMQRSLRSIGSNSIYLETPPVTHHVPKIRCNLNWLLKRSFRQGVERGIIATRRDYKEAEAYKKKENFRLFLARIKALMQFSGKKRYRFNFHKRRHDGYVHALRLYQDGKLSNPPYFDFTK